MVNYDPIYSSDQILFASMLQIYNLRYFKYFWIIKCVGIKPIIFAINLDALSFSKVFNTFNFVFLSIVFTNLNQ